MHFTIKSLVWKNIKIPRTLHKVLSHWLNGCWFPGTCHFAHILRDSLFSFSSIDNSHCYVVYFVSQNKFNISVMVFFFISVKTFPLLCNRVRFCSVSLLIIIISNKISFFYFSYILGCINK